MPDDVLRIRNMRFYGYHGLLPEEAKMGQHYEVDVEIFGSFRGWATHGAHPDVEKVEGAVNYPDIYNLVESIVVRERFGMVEDCFGYRGRFRNSEASGSREETEPSDVRSFRRDRSRGLARS